MLAITSKVKAVRQLEVPRLASKILPSFPPVRAKSFLFVDEGALKRYFMSAAPFGFLHALAGCPGFYTAIAYDRISRISRIGTHVPVIVARLARFLKLFSSRSQLSRENTKIVFVELFVLAAQHDILHPLTKDSWFDPF